MTSFFEEVTQQEKAEEEKNLPPKEAQGDTLEEIQKDSNKSRLFGMYLEEEGDHEIAFRMMKNELTDDDIENLRERRKGFLETSKAISEMEGQLDGDIIRQLAEASPELKKIAEIRGPESIRNSIVQNLSEVAIKDKERFKKMAGVFKMKGKHEEKIKKESEDALKLAMQHGLSRERYKAALIEMRKNPLALDKAVKDSMGIFKSVFSSARSIQEKADALDKRSAIDQHRKTIEGLNKDLGNALRAVLMENETVRKNFLGGLSAEKQEAKQPEMSYKEAIKLKQEVESKGVSKDELKGARKGWADYYNKHSGDKGFDLSEARSSFSKEYAADQVKKKGAGLWSIIVSMFLADKIESALKSTK